MLAPLVVSLFCSVILHGLVVQWFFMDSLYPMILIYIYFIYYMFLFQESAQLRRDKYLCCCCCKSGPLSCSLRLDRTGYVPGEDINVDAEIQNLSRKEITASYVTMQQVQSKSLESSQTLWDHYETSLWHTSPYGSLCCISIWKWLLRHRD